MEPVAARPLPCATPPRLRPATRGLERPPCADAVAPRWWPALHAIGAGQCRVDLARGLQPPGVPGVQDVGAILAIRTGVDLDPIVATPVRTRRPLHQAPAPAASPSDHAPTPPRRLPPDGPSTGPRGAAARTPGRTCPPAPPASGPPWHSKGERPVPRPFSRSEPVVGAADPSNPLESDLPMIYAMVIGRRSARVLNSPSLAAKGSRQTRSPQCCSSCRRCSAAPDRTMQPKRHPLAAPRLSGTSSSCFP